MPRKRSSSKQSSFGISEAGRILGVSDATLRHWTDQGEIRAFITPGGHRRYSQAELNRFMGSQQVIRGIKDQVAGLKDTVSHHREIAQKHLGLTSGYTKLTKESQANLAESGRRLLNLVIQYMTQPLKREETMELVREVGRDHGQALASLGSPLIDSLEAFMMHRNLLVDAATPFTKRGVLLSKRAVEAILLVTRVMDEAMVSLAAAHQGYQATTEVEGSEDNRE